MVSPILLIVLPLLAAFLIPAVSFLSKKSGSLLATITLLFNLFIISSTFQKVLANPIIVEIGGWKAPFGINLYIDTMAITAVLVINFIGLILAIYNIRKSSFAAETRFHTLFLLIIAGASGIVLTGDLFNLFVFIEITSIAAYGLATFKRNGGFEASFKYIIIGSIGSVLLLIAIGLTYASTGSLNMAEIARTARLLDPELLRIITLLFLVGIGIEAELFPLNFWVPDVYTAAPTAVSSILSGAVSVAGVYALIRIFFTLFADPGLYIFLMVIGAITLIIGELIAYQQENIKRMLAYSSIAQMGIVVAVISINTGEAVSAGLFQLLNHSILKVLLFVTAGLMAKAVSSEKIDDLSGLGRKMPLTAVGFTVGAMGITGVPFFNGFVSKMMIVNSSLNAGQYLLTVLILFATVVEIGYYLKVVQKLFFTGSSREVKKDFPCLIPVGILIVLVFVIGIYPDLITGTLNQISEELLTRSGYIISVLGGV